jgi:hypothetical protein
MLEYSYAKIAIRLLKIALQATKHSVNVSPLVLQKQRFGVGERRIPCWLHGWRRKPCCACKDKPGPAHPG